MSVRTGGPAYPLVGSTWNQVLDAGLTLRDRIAIAALPALISEHGARSRDDDLYLARPTEREMIARRAYLLADAMLAERERC